MRHIFLIICLLYVYTVDAVNFKHLGMKEGLSQFSVMSICQDELGRMWFGTEEGLNMYDGIGIHSFKPGEKAFSGDLTSSYLLGNMNFPIESDGKGGLYIVSDNALLRYDFRDEQFESLVKSGVRSVFIHKDKGDVWVGISDSVCRWNSAKHIPELLMNIKGETIQKLFVDSRNFLWIGTWNGLYCSIDRKHIKRVISGENIVQLYEDSKSNLWVATLQNGLFKLDKHNGIQKYMHIPGNANSLVSDQVRDFVEDNKGNLWIGTFAGLNRYDQNKGTFTLYRQDSKPGSLFHSSVFSLCKDRQGNIWVGTYYGGVHFFNPEADIFTLYSSAPGRKDCLSFPFVGKMVEDSSHNLWICTEGGGLNFYDHTTGEFTHFLMGSRPNSIAHNNLKGICYSKSRNKLYIGTHMGGLSIYDITRKTFQNLRQSNPSLHSQIGEVINQVYLYQDKYLFIRSRSGIFKMNLNSMELTPIIYKGSICRGSNFLIDSRGRIWIAWGSMIIRINLKDDKDVKTFPIKGKRLGHFSINKIFEDEEGQLFFGTEGAGLFVLNQKTDTFIGFTAEKDFLLSNYCYDIVQSPEGHLIISSDKGLSFFDLRQKTFRVIELGGALPISGINYGCGMLVCGNGEIFVGGVDGAVSFFESDFPAASRDYQLYFSALSINNEQVHPEREKGIISEAIPYIHQLTLKYNQNNFILTFTSDNYVNMMKQIIYEYRLEGFDDKWVKGTGNSISYTNLNPGKYTLVVREKQLDRQSAPRIIKMAIVIKPPLWATPLAYLFYVMVCLLIVYRFYLYQRSRLRVVTTLEFERKEKKRIEELNEAKLQFFSNISHEFRTPLTLIIVQIEMLLHKNDFAPTVYNQLLKVYKNATRLRDLISELLTFRKLEQGQVRLKVAEYDIVGFLQEIYVSFRELAKESSVELLFHSSQTEISCWFDKVQMQKVFYNLLSNAFKYTEAKGCIELTAGLEKDYVEIRVIDNGIGIRKEELDRIFDRFYQVDNKESPSSFTAGTGIGLSLSKNIVELHHGSISVESMPDYGSIFTVRIPKNRNAYSEMELAGKVNVERAINPEYFSEEMTLVEEDGKNNFTEEGGERPHILIVEDNEELLMLLVSLFAPVYQVTVARNGKEGLQVVLEKHEDIDIVLSDIRMPVMSGTEMCLQLKSNFDVCHIPVVLLTAFASAEQNREGLQRGADDYIEKPFNVELLVIRCNNLVRNRKMLREKFTSQRDFNANLLATNSIDQHFLNEVKRILDQSLDKTEFSVNDLAKEIGVSRSSLFAKFKSLVGMTPNDFILQYKLKQACILLKSNSELTIADIAYQLGFSSPHYFSRCFKAQFNVTPAGYRKNDA